MIFKAELVKGMAKTAHPYGCRKEVFNQIEYCKNAKQFNGAKKVLIIGASSGFGLATRISLAFGGTKADTIGVSFETGITNRRTGSAGWYNNIFFKEFAEKEGLIATNFIGDAFSDEIKEIVINYIKKEFGKIDLFVYSVASPRRKDPKTGKTYNSTIKATDETFYGPTIDIEKDELVMTKINSATQEEIEATQKVMGGEDWNEWCRLLLENDCIEKKAMTIAYSYIGSQRTYKIYRGGTIGTAKCHLENTALKINEEWKKNIDGKAFISVNKALVTKASAYIPTFSLYAAVLYKVMKENGVHENCIMQIQRMFSEKIYSGTTLKFDDSGRLRMDDLELREDIQNQVDDLWRKITPENFKILSDYEGYKREFMKLNGFEIDGVNYEENIDIETLKTLEQ
ncbi:enoyl-ACP reductase FabV [Clostridium aquiflavi]|uniref:Trans-2-enoyl-CoA reductase [NADH] n=1 Tax=Clostridium aquiflavi TaxID=3073603 RepID=A0ABU1ECK3_9CLOT|nr:enoyl-ACP reductase FabV [Clostridium sp. 5N-1]MDR5586110.1 trans-2-enoyl-CoA reductase family protein [Clostridium sp. 5N-1]